MTLIASCSVLLLFTYHISADDSVVLNQISADDSVVLNQISADDSFVLNRISANNSVVLNQISADDSVVLNQISADNSVVLNQISADVSVVVNQTTADDSVILNQTELVLTFLVHRHGDRTPLPEFRSLIGDNPELENLIATWGYGQLTNVGLRRGYKVGQFIRRRYGELLSDRYNRSEIYIRSTDSKRTMMTVLTAMAAVYPALGDSWSQDINWVPVPYTTVAAKYDTNAPFINCPTYIAAYDRLKSTPSPKMDRFVEVLSNNLSVTNEYGDVRSPGFASAVYDIFVSEISLGVDLGDHITKLMPELKAAADEAYDIVTGDENILALQAGVLLKEFFNVTATVRAGKDTQRVRVYSSHDFNVYSFEAISKITPRQGFPNYGSIFALELRKVLETGKYVVLITTECAIIFSPTQLRAQQCAVDLSVCPLYFAKPVYVKSPEEPELYLQVEGCSDMLCDIDEFYAITSKYILDENEYRTKCGWTEDLVIDSSCID